MGRGREHDLDVLPEAHVLGIKVGLCRVLGPCDVPIQGACVLELADGTETCNQAPAATIQGQARVFRMGSSAISWQGH